MIVCDLVLVLLRQNPKANTYLLSALLVAIIIYLVISVARQTLCESPDILPWNHNISEAHAQRAHDQRIGV